MNFLWVVLYPAYQLVYSVGLPVYWLLNVLGLLKRNSITRTTKIGNAWHRLGMLPYLRDHSGPVFWLHGVSVGEVLSLEYVINRLHTAHANPAIVVTTNTVEAFTLAQKRFGHLTHLAYVPFDFFFAIGLALWRVRPQQLTIVESDMWPSMLLLSRLCGVSVSVVNARLNTSKLAFGVVRWWYRMVYGIPHEVYTATPEVFEQIGILKKNVHTMGLLKIANVMRKRTSFATVSRAPRRSVVLIGSIHQNELPYYIQLIHALSEMDVHVMFVPRHLAQTPSIHGMLKLAGIDVHVCDSSDDRVFVNNLEEVVEFKQASIVNKMGVLFELHKYATIFCLGGTFNAVGGHNVFEAAVWKLPIVVGPTVSHHNLGVFALQKEGGLIQVSTPKELIGVVKQLIINRSLREQCAERNYQYMQQQTEQVQTQVAKIYRI